MNDFSRNVLFSRMIGLVSETELETLKNKRVAIPGCGGTGYTYAECMVRMGVGAIHLSDCDTFAPENMNRQFGCTTETINQPKVDVLHDRLMSINPELNANKFTAVGEDNIDKFLENVDVVCDTMDFFVIRPRRLMYQEARKRGITVVICCPVAWGVTGHIFEPNGMSFDEFFGITDEMSEIEQLSRFGSGLAPAKLYSSYIDSPKLDFEKKKVSSLSATCLMATSWGSSLALNVLLDNGLKFRPVPYCYNFDIRECKLEKMHFPQGVHKTQQSELIGAV